MVLASAPARYWAAARVLVPPAALGVFPVLATLVIVLGVHSSHLLAYDFHHAFWPAEHRLLDGSSPYVDPGSAEVTRATAFVYPAPAALLLAPFGALPRPVGEVVITLLCLGAIPATLALLGVRDYRVYGAFLLSAPAVYGWQTGNLTLLLMLGLAGAWKVRDRAPAAGLLVGLLVAVKLFLWPLGIWLLATRRFGATAWAVGVTVVANAAAWLVLGFDQLSRYSHLLESLTSALEQRAFTIGALMMRLGATSTTAHVAAWVLAAVVLAACVVAGRRGQDATALTLAIAASLLATPLVWLHYFCLLAVPLALARPRLDWTWGLFGLMWLCTPADAPSTPKMALGVLLALATVWVTVARLEYRHGDSNPGFRRERAAS